MTDERAIDWESASRCDKCGEVTADIDAGFSLALHALTHGGCGGTWRAALWDRDTGASRPKPGRPELPPDERRDRMVRARVTADEAAKWERLGGAEWLRRVLARAKEP